MGKKSGKKGTFGIYSEDVHQLRRAMRTAAELKGERIVLDLLSVECLKTACESVTINMTRRDFGDINNAIKKLMKPAPKGNKYADLRNG